MMKVLLALAALAVVLAVGTVAYLLVEQSQAPEAAAPPETVVAEPFPMTPEPVAALPAAPVQSAPAATSPEPATDAPPVEPTPAAAEAKPLAADLNGFVRGLNHEEADKLYQAVKKRELARMQNQAKYMLPADQTLGGLGYTMTATADGKMVYLNPELRLSDEQLKQLRAIKETLKPRLDLALGTLPERYDALAKKQMDFWMKHRTPETQEAAKDEIAPVQAELQEVNGQLNQVRQQFNTEYLGQAQGLLTPAQAAALVEQQKRWDDLFKGTGGMGPGGGR